MKRQFTVSILNQKLKVQSDANETHVSEVAGLVNKRVQEVIVGRTESVPPVTAALLAGLNIADEFLRFRQERSARTEKIEKKIKDLIGLIDAL